MPLAAKGRGLNGDQGTGTVRVTGAAFHKQTGTSVNYVDANLMPEEVVIYRTRLHWILFAGPVLATVVLAALWSAMSSADYVSDAGTSVFLVIAVLFGIAFLAGYIEYRSSEFAVTNQRVLFKVGFLRHRSIEILLAKVEALTVDQPLLGRILDYGSITIGGTGGTQERFNRIRAPHDFRRTVQEQAGPHAETPPASDEESGEHIERE